MHILVVDDDPEALTITQRLLERRGHTVAALLGPFGASNHVAGRGHPKADVVVLDFMMPGLSGEALVELWAQDPVLRTTPVVLYSAADMAVLSAATLRHPRCGAVQKGSGTQALLDEVERLKTAR